MRTVGRITLMVSRGQNCDGTCSAQPLAARSLRTSYSSSWITRASALIFPLRPPRRLTSQRPSVAATLVPSVLPDLPREFATQQRVETSSCITPAYHLRRSALLPLPQPPFASHSRTIRFPRP